jgi:hypothetical protein
VSLLETQGKEAIGINRPRVLPKNGIKTSLKRLNYPLLSEVMHLL